ncbi:MAG: RluA family pseudouridine synthase [Phascolarctobacterium sp.]|nr:RluA family pseudouridine synthase [Phascolarctobacterium sp.]MBQ5600730.1 RluA family pseudouridine synthase [Phascolarctobacterium sp.]MBQ6618215.1 RluA family pseudouridine synthase [Phascolarctobacterium sp.]
MESIANGISDEREILIITENEAGQRADVALAAMLELTRSNMQKLLDEGRAVKGTKVIKSNYKLKLGDEIIVTLPEPQPLDVQPENIPLDIIYEDEDVVVVNKARGMVVHPAAGNYSGTLVNALLYHCKNLSGINGVIRPGIVHRLDKDTSGIMICAKNDAAHVSLSEQIQSKTAQRTYLAVVRGNIKTDSGVIETQIARDKDDRKKMAVVKEGGRNAVTEYEVVERFGKYTIVKCKLKTGRTHQIRVHMEYLGYPLVGDPKYSPMKTPFSINGQALHSLTLAFDHPRTGERMEFEAKLPEDLHKVVTRLRLGQFN